MSLLKNHISMFSMRKRGSQKETQVPSAACRSVCGVHTRETDQAAFILSALPLLLKHRLLAHFRSDDTVA